MESLIAAFFSIDISLKGRCQSENLALINAPKLSFKRSRNPVPYLKLDQDESTSKTKYESVLCRKRKCIARKMKIIEFNRSCAVLPKRFCISEIKQPSQIKMGVRSSDRTPKMKRLSIYDKLKRLSR